jgi:hypothetical protein
LVVAKEQTITAQCIGTTSEEIEFGAEHREVPKESAAVERSGIGAGSDVENQRNLPEKYVDPAKN